jgi:hypothetical protein
MERFRSLQKKFGNVLEMEPGEDRFISVVSVLTFLLYAIQVSCIKIEFLKRWTLERKTLLSRIDKTTMTRSVSQRSVTIGLVFVLTAVR